MNTISIWAPRFKDKTVLIKAWRVQPGRNRIVFTKTWQDKTLYMDGEQIRSYPMQGHGKTGVHVVPVDDFEKEDSKQLSLEEIWNT